LQPKIETKTVYMTNLTIAPDFIFESSWEVCNKVGGIYTALSTRAKTLQELFPDRTYFIGPDLRRSDANPDFLEDPQVLSGWRRRATKKEGLAVRTGRWNVPGRPVVILVDFAPFFERRDVFYYEMWERFGIDSTVGYGDYDEAAMFALAAATVMESLYRFLKLDGRRAVAHLNEWMLGMAVLYLHDRVPGLATVFTTHATSIGRSICGNNKPLYGELLNYDGDQMARELNVVGKHVLEKEAARHADCFTTVSRITGRESAQLLGKAPDVITPNGFEPNFVPRGRGFEERRAAARRALIGVTERLIGRPVAEDALLVATSGRYEYRNKGIDVFIEAMYRVKRAEPKRTVVAFILVPTAIAGPRRDLQERLAGGELPSTPLPDAFFTHELVAEGCDPVCGYLRHLRFTNEDESGVKLVFVPSYLNGDDGIFNLPYYDLLIGLDLTLFPSCYEPWGYTPLESIAFHVPTITTNLAGFGLWAEDVEVARGKGPKAKREWGVNVVCRTDENYFEVAEAMKETVVRYLGYGEELVATIRNNARALSRKADWSHFIRRYQEAYAFALNRAELRK
jgi:glycosyltransferase involved in cell wall biosynthesis